MHIITHVNYLKSRLFIRGTLDIIREFHDKEQEKQHSG